MICNDCLNEFKTDDINIILCKDCNNSYSIDDCIHIYKIMCSTGFKSERVLKEYQEVKKSYYNQTGKHLPILEEKVKCR